MNRLLILSIMFILGCTFNDVKNSNAINILNQAPPISIDTCVDFNSLNDLTSISVLIFFILTTNITFASCNYPVNLLEKCPSKAQIASMEYQKKFLADVAAKKAADAKLAATKKVVLNKNVAKTTKPKVVHTHKG